MVRFIKQKIKNQLWLSCCLFLGLSLLVAVFCCQAIFQRGSLDRILQYYFEKNISVQERYPAVSGWSGKYEGQEKKSIEKMDENLKGNQENLQAHMGDDIPIISHQRNYTIYDYAGRGEFSDRESHFHLCYMEGLESHIEMIDGVGPEEAEEPYPCWISDKVMDSQRLTLGETIRFSELTDSEGRPLAITVAGIYQVKDVEDTFWCVSPYKFENEVFFTRETYEKILNSHELKRVFYDDFFMLDYSAFNSENIDHVKQANENLFEENSDYSHNYGYVFTSFNSVRWSMTIMFIILELPIFGMIFPFIYMVSDQIASREQAEIAMLKSRGVYRRQVLTLYLYRTCTIALFAFIAGIPLGYLFCKIAAKATDFLVFSGLNTGDYILFAGVLPYALVAVILGIICIMLPVCRHSKISIVEYTAGHNTVKRMAWQKYGLDIILIIVSLYLAYVYQKNLSQVQSNVSGGDWTDPLIFLDACLFIIAAGLFGFRLMQYFVKFVYRIGRKKWKTVAYTAFLQITRSFRKQMFISIFMIVTVAMGLFYANAARTMNHNKEDRVQYSMGAEARFTEKWWGQPYIDENGNRRIRYEESEPDYGKYTFLTDSGLVDSYTRVLWKNKMSAVVQERIAVDCQVFAIEPAKFGKTAYLLDSLHGETHWYNYLNALAQNPDGAIISSNLAEKMHLTEDSLIRVEENSYSSVRSSKCIYVKVVAIVDAWPGFNQYEGKEESNLVVVNLASYLQGLNLYPYEIWVDLKDGVSSKQLEDYVLEQGVEISKFSGLDQEIEEMKMGYMLHITNGLFSLTFLIAIILCAIGFLIYWISSIGQRELLFGVYRAMGLSVREINRMLLYEHIFSTLLSVLAGGVIGILATSAFAVVFAVVYLPEKSNVLIQVYSQTEDMVRMFLIIFAVIVLCLLILRRQIKKLNIAQALKLGED